MCIYIIKVQKSNRISWGTSPNVPKLAVPALRTPHKNYKELRHAMLHTGRI